MAVALNKEICIAFLIIISTFSAGCFEKGEESEETIVDWDKGLMYIDDPLTHDDPRDFIVASAVKNETWGNSSWAVFGNEEGGNCCEHYLAGTKEGWIVNFGGEYPTWSEDRGHTWNEYIPGIFSQIGCLEPKPTVPGQEGLGEGSIVQATNGDLISMGWFPYPSTSGADQFYAFLYDADTQEWNWCFNRTPEPFYDRSWQVEVIGPINGGIYGNGEYASIVISNFWHQVQNIGGQISTDGLNYDYFSFPDRDASLDIIEVDLTAEMLGEEWDFTKPHKEMRAFPVPSGGLYFPNYFIDGRDAYVDTSLNWWSATTLNGSSLPSEYCAIDSSTALHCVLADDNVIQHLLSWDGGETWENNTYDLKNQTSGIEEWEFHSNGIHDLFVLNVRYQSSEGPDIDIAWHVRDYSESLIPDVKTYLGQGDLDSTSGAGADIRFDFASMGILPDGGSFIAYHDSTDPDPLFGLELLLPEEYQMMHINS
tara:strand:- start:4225 stop:5667 length:1443 start_codon:yes stop_codon:yes gene_type:complete